MDPRRAVPFERSEPLPGLVLVTERMRHVRSVSIGLWVDVGSRDEPDELAGASHLLEHLLFKGTPTRSARDIADTIDAAGGELNAYTAKEHTCYYARVLDTDLHVAGDILFDMYRHALLREEDLTSERKVVLEEIAMAHDVPEDRVGDLFVEHMWPGHPLGRPVIGFAETVGSMDRESLASYYGRRYVPGRLVVAAAGNVEHAAVGDLIVSSLGEGGVFARRNVDTSPDGHRPRTVHEKRTTEQVHLVWGCPSLRRKDPDRYAQSVLNVIYGGGMSSRLFQEIREKHGLAYSIYSGYHMYQESGAFSVYAGTHDVTAATVLEIVREQAADLASGGVTEQEVERSKGQVKGNLVLSMDDPGGRMTRLGRSELLHGEIVTVDELLERIDGITVADITRVARRVFGADGFTLAAVGPLAEAALDRFAEPLGV